MDRYGGLIRIARRLVEIGENENGPIYDEELFPVSSDVTEKECWEGGRYNDLRTSSIVLDLIKALNIKLKALDDPFPIASLEFRVVNQEPKHPGPFLKYGYHDRSEMWMYSYDYMALVVEVKCVFSSKCELIEYAQE